MSRVNEALAAMGDDTLTGTKLLREVLRHKDTPLEVRIQCAGLVLKQETPTADETPSVTHMPPALPGDSTEAQQAVWMALYSTGPDDDPEWNAAVANIMRLIHTRQKPETL